MEKNLYILSGVSGSGKTTFTKSIVSIYPEVVVCSADKYFYSECGVYNFDPTQLTHAHNECKSLFDDAIKNDEPVVIVDNTNTREWEYKHYKDAGQENGYTVHMILIHNHHGNESVHRVPKETIAKQTKNIKNTFNL